MSPGVARASASSGLASVALPAGHVLEIAGATASIEATCRDEVVASWGVAAIHLDGVALTHEAPTTFR